MSKLEVDAGKPVKYDLSSEDEDNDYNPSTNPGKNLISSRPYDGGMEEEQALKNISDELKEPGEDCPPTALVPKPLPAPEASALLVAQRVLDASVSFSASFDAGVFASMQPRPPLPKRIPMFADSSKAKHPGSAKARNVNHNRPIAKQRLVPHRPAPHLLPVQPRKPQMASLVSTSEKTARDILVPMDPATHGKSAISSLALKLLTDASTKYDLRSYNPALHILETCARHEHEHKLKHKADLLIDMSTLENVYDCTEANGFRSYSDYAKHYQTKGLQKDIDIIEHCLYRAFQAIALNNTVRIVCKTGNQGSVMLAELMVERARMKNPNFGPHCVFHHTLSNWAQGLGFKHESPKVQTIPQLPPMEVCLAPLPVAPALVPSVFNPFPVAAAAGTAAYMASCPSPVPSTLINETTTLGMRVVPQESVAEGKRWYVSICHSEDGGLEVSASEKVFDKPFRIPTIFSHSKGNSLCIHVCDKRCSAGEAIEEAIRNHQSALLNPSGGQAPVFHTSCRCPFHHHML